MGITEFVVQRKVAVYFFAALLVIGGVVSFGQLARLEDPDFTVKTGVVVTRYPGADPEAVELEVTDRIEKAIQELPAIDTLISWSKPGLSTVRVEVKQTYWADRLPQVWDEMRKKIRDITSDLPPGAGKPDVSDDFNFVYGFVLAVTGDGFRYEELEDRASDIKKELSLVPGIARVDLWGVQPRAIYIDIDETQLAETRLTPAAVANTLRVQNSVVDGGSIDVQDRRLRMVSTGEFRSPEDIGDLVLRPGAVEMLRELSNPDLPGIGQIAEASMTGNPADQASQLLRIRDVATVRTGYLEPTPMVMRHNGQPALAIQLAAIEGGNIVETGRLLDRRIQELLPELPVGIELHRVAWQSELVSQAIGDFMISLLEAVAIVLVVLAVPTGLRMGFIIGAMLVFIILGTFVYMSLTATPLHRMSLGALIIALGMMVDNSCFVADAMCVEFQRGTDRIKAAIACARARAWPLLGATVIAVMAFYPIFASPINVGEYCAALFTVVATALLFSWFISMTLTPVLCLDMLPEADPDAEAKDPYDTKVFRGLRRLATIAIRFRWSTVLILSSLLVGALSMAGNVRTMFFPDSTRNQLMIDYWAPVGTRIEDVSRGIRPIEKRLQDDPRVQAVSTFVGGGPPRFYLPVDPEIPQPEYAQLVVTAESYKEIYAIAAEIEPWLKQNIDVLTRVRKYGVGPSDSFKFEARISGPATADLATLRRLGEQGKAILRANPLARDVRTEMRNPVQKVVARYNQERGRWATVTRADLASATRRAHDGETVGLYREGEDLLPIIVREGERDRRKLADNLDTIQIAPQLSTQTIPLGQVADAVTLEWEDPIIHRWQRRRTETVQCAPVDGVTFPELKAAIGEDFVNALELPPGYKIFWDGEEDSTVEAQSSLQPGLIPAIVIIALIVVLLYNSLRVLLAILLVVPFAAVGIVPGLVLVDSPMGFVAILGVLSLMGMMIKNMIVMTDAIRGGINEGMHPFDACVQSVVTQARPIALAAGTTVMGVIPLLADVFWNAMAVAIMFGLGVGGGLTILLYPALYAILHGIKAPART